LYFWWMGSHPWFLFTGFFFLKPSTSGFISNLLGSTRYHCELSVAQWFHNPLKIS
jgi:hypothetical protein